MPRVQGRNKLGQFKKYSIPWNKEKRMIKVCNYCRKKFKAKYPYLEKVIKFCSHSCYLKNKIGTLLSNKTKKKISKSLMNHKISVKTRKLWSKQRRGRKWSKEQRKNHINCHSLENHYNWQGGKSFEPYSTLFNQQLKDRIRVRDNFICQKCQIPELELDERLRIHHIDYDKKNCKEDNLISLCNRCNIKANFNREYYSKYFSDLLQEKSYAH